jgi:hypothetical protein
MRCGVAKSGAARGQNQRSGHSWEKCEEQRGASIRHASTSVLCLRHHTALDVPSMVVRGVTRLAVGGVEEHGHQEEAEAEEGAHARHGAGTAGW